MGRKKSEVAVLVVDDDPMIRPMLAEALRYAGCRVLTAADGVEATEILGEERVDILITDYDMPRMNGLDLIRWSRTRFPHLTAAMITGESCPALAARGRECGAAGVFLKPFPVTCLLALVEEVRGTAPGP
jgi:DNA-binding response OmpR family regulator